jgi:probable phosphoglycerate mutase
VRRLVVQADGGSRGNPGPAGYGAVVTDADSGEVLAERAEFLGTATNNVAEYRGLVAGLLAAREIDPDALVDVRLDSKLIVEQMSGRWKIKHPDMRPLALAAREVLPPERVTYTWVPRAQNAHADRLANEAMDAGGRGQEWTPAPVGGDDEAQDVTAVPRNVLVGWARGLGTPTTFVLLRHGETEHTTAKRFSGSGSADMPLTETGAEQAGRAAAELAGSGLEAVVASPLRRAQQTAGVVAEACGLDVRTVDGLRECDFGEWEGHTLDEVQERWPAELEAWLGSTAVAPPGGESFDAVTRRVRRVRDQVVARHPERTVLVVTHVTPIKVMVGLALEAGVRSLFRMELQPASLTTLQWFPDGNASLRVFNETAHLRR